MRQRVGFPVLDRGIALASVRKLAHAITAAPVSPQGGRALVLVTPSDMMRGDTTITVRVLPNIGMPSVEKEVAPL